MMKPTISKQAVASMTAAKVPDTIREIDAMAPKLLEALPAAMDGNRFLRSIKTAIWRDPELLNKDKTDARTLLEAVTKAAEDGLYPDRSDGVFIRRWNWRKKKCDVVFQPMVRGVIRRIIAGSDVIAIDAHVVYRGDDFASWNEDGKERLVHRRKSDGQADSLITHAYAVATYKGGEYRLWRVVSRSEIERARQASDAGRDNKEGDKDTRKGPSGPWVTDYAEMAKKTAVHRLAKYLPVSGDMIDWAQEAERRDAIEVEANVVVDEDAPPLPDHVAPPPAKEPEPEHDADGLIAEDDPERGEPLDVMSADAYRSAIGRAWTTGELKDIQHQVSADMEMFPGDKQALLSAIATKIGGLKEKGRM